MKNKFLGIFQLYIGHGMRFNFKDSMITIPTCIINDVIVGNDMKGSSLLTSSAHGRDDQKRNWYPFPHAVRLLYEIIRKWITPSSFRTTYIFNKGDYARRLNRI